MEFKSVIELISVLVMLFGTWAVYMNRKQTKKGIGKRIIQLETVVLLIPTVLILSLERILNVEIIGTLLGAIIGYILSDLAKNDPTEK